MSIFKAPAFFLGEMFKHTGVVIIENNRGQVIHLHCTEDCQWWGPDEFNLRGNEEIGTFIGSTSLRAGDLRERLSSWKNEHDIPPCMANQCYPLEEWVRNEDILDNGANNLFTLVTYSQLDFSACPGRL
jgi:hypothetical protein